MGLWEDAQAQKLPEDGAAQLAAAQAAQLREFVNGMSRLGVPPSHFPAIEYSDEFHHRIKKMTITGWSIRDRMMQEPWLRGVNAPVVVTPNAELVDCCGQRPPKKTLFSSDPFVLSTQSLPAWSLGYDALSDLLREALARAIRR